MGAGASAESFHSVLQSKPQELATAMQDLTQQELDQLASAVELAKAESPTLAAESATSAAASSDKKLNLTGFWFMKDWWLATSTTTRSSGFYQTSLARQCLRAMERL